MKKIILAFILAIFLLSLASATKVNQTLKIDTPVTVNGKTITLKYTESNMLILDVDGLTNRYTFTTTMVNDTFVYSPNITLNGVFFKILDIIDRVGEVRAEITISYTCGNKVCEINEKGFCCKDCNCSSSEDSCIDNQCILTTLNQCLNNSQCNDNNNCTIDNCTGIPRQCTHEIKPCKDYDYCCPQGCTFDNDADCPRTSCASNLECNDKDPCTEDACNLQTKNCTHEKQQGCEYNQTCQSIGSIKKISNVSKYCSDTGWQAKKSSGACKQDYECTIKCTKGDCGVPVKTTIPKTSYIIIGAVIFIVLILLIRHFRIHKISKLI
ncbi:hypothetical protein HZA33_02200 [Candidatus Pacearchaeota archaeon]|nr:hypothetical protein [Candidatus Pacearchaeota archaeon]